MFFPSFSFLQLYLRHLHTSQQFARLNQKKRLFVEERGKDVFSEYASFLREPSAQASLFAVVGGKLSEGINFSDDLGRCIAIVGMPYPNKEDVVLKERMQYMDARKPGSGQQFYSNLCIKAVNQAIIAPSNIEAHVNTLPGLLFKDSQQRPWEVVVRVFDDHVEVSHVRGGGGAALLLRTLLATALFNTHITDPSSTGARPRPSPWCPAVSSPASAAQRTAADCPSPPASGRTAGPARAGAPPCPACPTT